MTVRIHKARQHKGLMRIIQDIVLRRLLHRADRADFSVLDLEIAVLNRCAFHRKKMRMGNQHRSVPLSCSFKKEMHSGNAVHCHAYLRRPRLSIE